MMLVLSRKPQQTIVIGDEIRITVVEMGRGRVQIGISAPDYLPIYREEIVRRMIARGEIDSLPCLESGAQALAVG
jgi:carbon storage regulator